MKILNRVGLAHSVLVISLPDSSLLFFLSSRSGGRGQAVPVLQKKDFWEELVRGGWEGLGD